MTVTEATDRTRNLRVVAGIPVWNEDAHTIAGALASCKPLDGAFRFVGDLSVYGTHTGIRQHALKIAREVWGADWLLQMDADERLYNGEKLVDYLQSYAGFAYPIPIVQDDGTARWAPFVAIKTDSEIVCRMEYIRRNGINYVLTGYAPLSIDDVSLTEPYIYHTPNIRPEERRTIHRMSDIEEGDPPPPEDAVMYFPPLLGGKMPGTVETNEAGEVISEEPYYCPACGLRYETPGYCEGTAEAGHEATPVEKTSGGKKSETTGSTPDESWTVGQIQTYAEEHGIELGNGSKADKLAQIAEAEGN